MGHNKKSTSTFHYLVFTFISLIVILCIVLFVNDFRFQHSHNIINNLHPIRITSSLRNSSYSLHHTYKQILSRGIHDASYNFQSISPGSPTIHEIKQNLTLYIKNLHKMLNDRVKLGTAALIWETYLNITNSTLINWDSINFPLLPKQRHDHSIFISIASFRDSICPMTLQSLFGMAKYPDSLYVALIQQNCFEEKCWSGYNQKQKAFTPQGTDVDCVEEFCNSYEGKQSNACNTGQLRVLNINETEGLGPFMARYFASKFYRGEHYYLQIDSHSEFVKHWDEKLIKMIHSAPALKPIISSYPPAPHDDWMDSPGFRVCDSEFVKEEFDVIRLTAATQYEENIPNRPRYAPFIAAGFLFAEATVLLEVPFDPLVPWLFMGEEIAYSSRLWTSGYDFFSPTTNILNHYYVREDVPKFWESIDRFYGRFIFDELNALVLWRIKWLLRYPEAINGNQELEEEEEKEVIGRNKKAPHFPDSISYRITQWSFGKERSYDDYLAMVGINMTTKSTVQNAWCHAGLWPKIAKRYKVRK